MALVSTTITNHTLHLAIIAVLERPQLNMFPVHLACCNDQQLLDFTQYGLFTEQIEKQ